MPCVGLLLTLAAACSDADVQQQMGPTVSIKVMTRNLFLGADLSPVVTAPTAADIPERAGNLWREVMASRFPERARLIAEEIAAELPELVGLQEVELFRTQVPSDFDLAEPAVNATEVAVDFLGLLLGELESRGLSYSAVSEGTYIDAELPANLDGISMDIRLTDRDVILVREGVRVTTPQVQEYPSLLHFKMGGVNGVPVKLARGLGSVEVEYRGAHFTFGNTHLESVGSFSSVLAGLQEAQAEDLLGMIAPVNRNVVLVGDFNSPADKSGTRSYARLTESLRDVYPLLVPSDPGYTCCSGLTNPTFGASERIDLILFRGRVREETVRVVGMNQRTSSGLWASDHAGVVASVQVEMQ